MFNKQALLKRKYFFLTGSLLLVILLLGLLEPVLLRNSEENWEKGLDSKISDLKSEAGHYFAKFEINLNQKAADFIKSISDQKQKQGLTEILNSSDWSAYSILIFDQNNKPAAFSNYTDSLSFVLPEQEKPERMFFLQTPLMDYLSVYRPMLYNGNNYKVLFSVAVEKKYILNTSDFKNISLKEEFTKKFQTAVEIYPGGGDIKPRDGRQQTIDILNSANEKIATMILDNPSLSVELNGKRELISFLQIICLFLLILILLKKIKIILERINSKPAKDFLVIIIIVALRVLFFVFEVPTRFVTGELTDASYFSSTFGYGIVRSPLDLFLTIISILCIAVLIYDAARSVNINSPFNRKSLRLILIPVLIILYFLFLRALGASIRSVVYDSQLKYFKDPFIIPDLPIFVMHLNVLLIGLSALLISISILLLLLKLCGDMKKGTVFLLFIFLQIAGYLYDLSQNEPQGNDFTRIIFILFAFFSAYWVLRNKLKSIFEYSIYLLLASFLSILLLNYYNKSLEKFSLPATAQEFLRGNEKPNEFMAIQTAIQFSKEPELIENFLTRDFNYNAQAFKLWSKSVLPREILSVHISILDKNLDELGHYDYNFDSHKKIDWNIKNGMEYHVRSIDEPFTNKRQYFVLTPVKKEDVLLGYIELAMCPLNDYFSRKQCYNILSSYNQRLNSTIDFTQLKVFSIADGEVKNSIGDVSLSDLDIKNFEETVKKESDEIYIEKEIDGKPHVVFLRRNNTIYGSGVLGVALRTRDLTVDLFDFFKVFFIHSIIILIFTLLVFLSKIRKLWQTLFNFRARLLYSLIIISIVPLFLSAIYFKSLVEEKNQEDISYKLNKRALQVERYLSNYFSQSSLLQKEVFDKAHKDLGVEYSVFDSEKLVYSTLPGFYKSTLLPEILNSDVKENLVDKNGKQILVTEKIDDFSFNSFYLKTRTGDKDLFININNAFNEISLSLSNLEVDIFLFGSYSFAAVLIILLSSFLAGQISKPIRELTRATTAVAEGDLDVKVDYKVKGEMNSLILGFNEMVEKLKKSQLELAEFERETAWKEMARQVAHEIKNPLTPMKLSIQQLVASYNDKSPKFNSIFEKVTSTIISQIETLNKIASEFSGFARMPKMNIEKIDVKKICDEAVNLFNSDLKIKISAGNEPVMVSADADQLKRSFINLIRNSIQAGARHIEIKIIETDVNVEIRFADDGRGIAKDSIEKIFDENFTTKTKGMGLGLSMAKKYFELLKGSISVANTSDKGTEFLIILPKAGSQ